MEEKRMQREQRTNMLSLQYRRGEFYLLFSHTPSGTIGYDCSHRHDGPSGTVRYDWSIRG